MSIGDWASRIAKQIPRCRYTVAERMNDSEIGIAVIVDTDHGPHRFAVRFPNPPTEEDLKQAAMNLNGRIAQHAGEAVT